MEWQFNQSIARNGGEAKGSDFSKLMERVYTNLTGHSSPPNRPYRRTRGP